MLRRISTSSGSASVPKVSLIITSCNTDAFIAKAIYSAINQSFPDIELIIIDDGSTDNSASIIKSFCDNDPRIMAFRHEENSGPGVARNNGIANARGEYIFFLDGDDYLDQNCIEVHLKAAISSGSNLVLSGHRAVDMEGNPRWQTIPDKQGTYTVHSIADVLSLTKDWGMPHKLWSRSILKREGLKFPPIYSWEDIAVFPTVVSLARSVRVIQYCGYNYLQRKNSITNKYDPNKTKDLILSLNWAKKNYQEHIHNPSESELLLMYDAFLNFYKNRMDIDEDSPDAEQLNEFLNNEVRKSGFFTRLKRTLSRGF